MIVLDTSVISAFSQIGGFALLQEIIRRIGVKAVIPQTVEEEIIFPEAISSLSKNGGWIDVKTVHDYKEYLFSLHEGESGVEKCNLVSVSSILPPNCRIIPKEEGLKHLDNLLRNCQE